ncbi:MAG: mechanosensitive ion channel, partial [Verrucomicrobiae bacterium]|nr:mechanosensitive ion channel [Verrucomicrobiae bacterium]
SDVYKRQTLLQADRSRVTIPNRRIIGEILHNYGATRQLDLKIGISYRSDIEQALTVVRQVLAASPRCLKDPVPVVGIGEFADSAICLHIKPWVRVTDYVAAPLEIYQAVAKRFRETGIEIPFPQREVRLLNAGAVPAAK